MFVCKPDYAKKITKLSESHIAAYIQTIRPGYDINAARAAVMARWSQSQEVAA